MIDLKQVQDGALWEGLDLMLKAVRELQEAVLALEQEAPKHRQKVLTDGWSTLR